MFAVHVKNSIPLSRIREKTQVGLPDKYRTRFEGVDRRDTNRYAKNFSKMIGVCEDCEHFVKSKRNTTTGEHCKAEQCVK